MAAVVGLHALTLVSQAWLDKSDPLFDLTTLLSCGNLRSAHRPNIKARTRVRRAGHKVQFLPGRVYVASLIVACVSRHNPGQRRKTGSSSAVWSNVPNVVQLPRESHSEVWPAAAVALGQVDLHLDTHDTIGVCVCACVRVCPPLADMHPCEGYAWHLGGSLL